MKELKARGGVMAMAAYFLYGLLFILSTLINEHGFDSYAAGTMVFWGITVVVLITGSFGNTYKGSDARQIMYIIFADILAVFIQLYWDASSVLYILFMVEWILVLAFIGKKQIHINSLVQILSIILLTVIPEGVTRFHAYDIRDMFTAILGILIADWAAVNVVKSIMRVYRDNREHDRSISDMLNLVEAKHSEAKHATNAKSQFLSNMSHEIRTPINSILGMNEMILRETNENHTKEYADNIKSAGELLLTLVNDVLDISKIEVGKMNLVPVNFELINIVRDLDNMIRPKAIEKGLDMSISCDESLPCGYRGDDIRIKQILVNLMNNAVKYTPSGGVELVIGGSFDKDTKLAVLDFRVKDTGMGIKPEDLKRLNEKFVRFNEEQNRYTEGSGLGITIVNGFLDIMDSKLEVSSEFGKGSVFGFKLELPVTDEEQIKNKSKISENQNVQKKSEEIYKCPEAKLLVVDDNAMNLKVFQGLLKRTEAKVESADNGQDAIEMSKKNKYDIIFMDHMMPGMDGIECVKRMSEIKDFLNENTPIVALTANSVAGAREMYLENGFSDFLSKPIRYEELEMKIKELLAKEE
ncbi:MAG: response regulator [Lachnospiraceae bacterium]|nr:response regulator [Lachnospiraceae bacterium]